MRYQTLQRVVRCLADKERHIGRGRAGLRRKLDGCRKLVVRNYRYFILGDAMFAEAAADPEFRRKMQIILEKGLKPRDRWVLRDAMREWGWPHRKL
jgi:hypothetical protein